MKRNTKERKAERHNDIKKERMQERPNEQNQEITTHTNKGRHHERTK